MIAYGKAPSGRHNRPGAHKKTPSSETQISTAFGPCNSAANSPRPPAGPSACAACRYFDLLLELAALVQEDCVTGTDMPAQKLLDAIETDAVRSLDQLSARGAS